MFKEDNLQQHRQHNPTTCAAIVRLCRSFERSEIRTPRAPRNHKKTTIKTI